MSGRSLVNNNYYTNYSAKWVLEYTSEVIDEMREAAPGELASVADRVGFDFDETLRWREVADGIILSYDATFDIFVQDDTFLSLDPIAREQLDPQSDIPIERKWTVEKKLKYQLLKQPDVLLAMFLFRERFSTDQKRSNYRFYSKEPRTGHLCLQAFIPFWPPRSADTTRHTIITFGDRGRIETT